MSEPYLGEIRMFGGNYAPQGWNLCQGQLLPIAENNALFSLLGTTYGGDGIQTFGLPDLRGRIPIHQGSGFTQGQLGGSETVTLITSQLPAHSHQALCNVGSTTTSSSPANAVWLNWAQNQYTNQAPDAQMNNGATHPSGGGQPHENLMPYLTVNFIIAMAGIYPSQN